MFFKKITIVSVFVLSLFMNCCSPIPNLSLPTPNSSSPTADFSSPTADFSSPTADLASPTPNESSYKSSGPCDAGLAIDSTDPVDAAKAMGICDGLVSAEWLLPDRSAKPENTYYDIGHGILRGFGSNVSVREGSRLLALSTGIARQPSDPGYVVTKEGFRKKASPSDAEGYTNNCPSGYPIEEPGGEPISSTGYDGIALKVVLNIPRGVKAFIVEYKYYTMDYPSYIKTKYADQSYAILTPHYSGAPSTNNIFFDATGNPLFSSSSAIDHYAGSIYESIELIGTGFEKYGATGWLLAIIPTADLGRQITIVFAIWDSGDSAGDSTLLIDNYMWIPTD